MTFVIFGRKPGKGGLRVPHDTGNLFVMLKCVGVFMWAVLEKKNEKNLLQTFADKS